jgi:hypothetical protein
MTMIRADVLEVQKAEDRVRQWTRRLEIIEDHVAMHIVEGRWLEANKAREIGQRAYLRLAREVSMGAWFRSLLMRT